MKRLLFISFITAFLCSCKHEQASDVIYPTVAIYTPVQNQQFVTGDTIKVTGLCGGDQRLTNAAVRITDNTTLLEIFYSQNPSLTANSFNVNTNFVVTTASHTRYTVAIIAIDAFAHSVERVLDVKIN